MLRPSPPSLSGCRQHTRHMRKTDSGCCYVTERLRVHLRGRSSMSSTSPLPPCLQTLTIYRLRREHLLRALCRFENAVEPVLQLLLYILPPAVVTSSWFHGDIVNYLGGRTRTFTETRVTVFVDELENDQLLRRLADRYTFVREVEQQVQRYIRDYLVNRRSRGPQAATGETTNVTSSRLGLRNFGAEDDERFYLVAASTVSEENPDRFAHPPAITVSGQQLFSSSILRASLSRHRRGHGSGHCRNGNSSAQQPRDRNLITDCGPDRGPDRGPACPPFGLLPVEPIAHDRLLCNLRIDLEPVCYRRMTLLVFFYRRPPNNADDAAAHQTRLGAHLDADADSHTGDAYWSLIEASRVLFAHGNRDEQMRLLHVAEMLVRGCHRCALERMRSFDDRDHPPAMLCPSHALQVHAWRERDSCWLSLQLNADALDDAADSYDTSAKKEVRRMHGLSLDPHREQPFRFVSGVYRGTVEPDTMATLVHYDGLGRDGLDDRDGGGGDTRVISSNLFPISRWASAWGRGHDSRPHDRTCDQTYDRTCAETHHDVRCYTSSLNLLLEEDTWRLYELAYREGCDDRELCYRRTKYHEFVQFDYASTRLRRLLEDREAMCEPFVRRQCEMLACATLHEPLPLAASDDATLGSGPDLDHSVLPLSFLRRAENAQQRFCGAVVCRVHQLRHRFFYRWLRRTWRPNGNSPSGDRLRAVVARWRDFTYAPRPESKLMRTLRLHFDANLALHCQRRGSLDDGETAADDEETNRADDSFSLQRRINRKRRSVASLLPAAGGKRVPPVCVASANAVLPAEM